VAPPAGAPARRLEVRPPGADRRYFADFVCREKQIIVEVDGGQHSESLYDERRDADLAALGYRIIRVWNNDVLGNIEGVLEMLLIELGGGPTPHPDR
jgi:very-short-patch-repair endonuclease